MPRNSTIGRALALTRPVRAAAFGGAIAVAPGIMARWVADLFSTPARPYGTRGRSAVPAHADRWARDGLAGWTLGRGPTVLLAHGWSGDACDLAAVAAALAGAGFRAVAFDMPAHGASTGRRTNLQGMTRALIDVARRHGPVAAVVAHSLGAAAATLALRDGLQTRAAVLLAPPRHPNAYLAAFMRVLGVPAAFAPRVRREMERRVGPLDRYDAARAATTLSTPALVLHDGGDRQVPLADGAAIAAAWSTATLTVLDGLGHRRLLRDPAVLAHIVAFVAEHTRGAGRPPSLPGAVTLEPAMSLAG